MSELTLLDEELFPKPNTPAPALRPRADLDFFVLTCGCLRALRRRRGLCSEGVLKKALSTPPERPKLGYQREMSRYEDEDEEPAEVE